MATSYVVDIVVDGPLSSSVPMDIYSFTRTDDLPDLIFNILDEDGDIVNLTAATSLFKIRKAGIAPNTNTGHTTCTVSIPNGTCTYNLIDTDFPTAGLYEGELVVNFSGPLQQTAYKLIYMKVRDPI